MSRLRQLLQRQEGITLVMAVGVLGALSLTGTTLIYYSSASARSAEYSVEKENAYDLAQAGVDGALAILNKAADPRQPALLASSTLTFSNGTATFSGVYDAATRVWTITSVGAITNPTGPGAGDVKRTITSRVQVVENPSGPTVSKWNRIYDDDTSSCLTLSSIDIPSPLTTRGNLCLTGTTKLTGSAVHVGGTTTLASNTSIGTSATPIPLFQGGSWCKWSTGPQSTPCTATNRVYANEIGTYPADLSKPLTDFAYWYANAKPGPNYPCNVTSGTVPVFDNNSVYDGSAPTFELTPESAKDNPGASGGTTGTNKSYTCQYWENGELVGELSWNMQTRVLTIKGTIFFDGSAEFHDHNGYVVRYQGKATIYIAKDWHNDEAVCAGGSGTATCRTAAAISNWDPTQNLMVLVIGDRLNANSDAFDFHTNYAAFQGLIWAKSNCKIREGAYSSGPIFCNKLLATTSSSGGFFPWPPINTLLAGMVNQGHHLPGDFSAVPLEQSG
jgi:Tfp pilus assembly protein PilV